jgi:hypothetical protein
MARDDTFDGLEPATDSRAKHNTTVFAKQLQDGVGPAAQTSLACCGTLPVGVSLWCLPLLAARVHRLTCGGQQGNPGQHSNDGAPALRKTKRSLEATDASGRPLAVVQLFDNLQQPSTWEVSPRTKHEVERLLRSDVSSRLVHPALNQPVSAAAIHGACFPPAQRVPKN